MSDKCPDTLDMFAEPDSQPTPDQLQQQAKAYAREKFDFALKKGFQPAGLHCYTDAAGTPLYWKVRLNPPPNSDQRKMIMPFYWNGLAFAKGEPVHPEAGKPLYNLQRVAAAQADPAAEVWIVEGEQKADALNTMGFIATTSGSSSSANKTDWQPLAGRTVRIWPDFDETLAGQKYASAVATILTGLGCAVSILDVAAIQIEGQPLPNKGDVMDWFEMREAAGLTTSAADVLALPLVPEAEPDQPDSGEGEPDSTQNARAREGDADLGLDESLEAELIRLATLPPFTYARQRKEAAKALGVSVAALDAEVEGRRSSPYAIHPDDPDRTPEPSRGFIQPPERDDRLSDPMIYGNGYFDMLENGLFYVEVTKEQQEMSTFICSPFRVLAQTRTGNGKDWGKLLEWHDQDGRRHQWAMPMEVLQGDCIDLRRYMASHGLLIQAGNARALLTTYLLTATTDKKALCVDVVGWQGNVFVLPEIVIGQSDEIIVYQSPIAKTSIYSSKGTLYEWQQQIARYAVGNPLLALGIACAFSGSLFPLLEQQSGGFHLRGKSSSGKSSIQEVAASVWGGRHFKETWRSTSNGMEAAAAIRNHCLLILDEISQASEREIGQAVYMLGNEKAKTRMDKSLIQRDAKEWRMTYLSSGEESLADILQRSGQIIKAGQETRLADIAADGGAGYGVFTTLHHFTLGSELSDHLKAACSRWYGVAGLCWLEWLTTDRDTKVQAANEHVTDFLSTYAPAKASGQVLRVAKRFAIVAAAGELATFANITGWKAGEATAAAAYAFQLWLSGFGMGDREEVTILKQVRAFLQAHGSSRFEPHDRGAWQAQPRTPNRVGYWRDTPTGREYLIFPEQFQREVCNGLDYQAVATLLRSHGHLKSQPDRLTHLESQPDTEKRQPFYVVRSSILNGTDGTDGTTIGRQGFARVPPAKPQTVQTVQTATVYRVYRCTETRRYSLKPLGYKACTVCTACTAKKTPLPADSVGSMPL